LTPRRSVLVTNTGIWSQIHDVLTGEL
jgi:hypothetical protein